MSENLIFFAFAITLILPFCTAIDNFYDIFSHVRKAPALSTLLPVLHMTGRFSKFNPGGLPVKHQNKLI
jgi:hypothetical protein